MKAINWCASLRKAGDWCPLRNLAAFADEQPLSKELSFRNKGNKDY